ncbi:MULTISPECIES: ABC-three component system middle component 6 [Actinotignum]|uniref:ABC-three component system middle component 6 n=1 Tax=Actinotignum TaxID=1653174 RepID=UPI0027BB20D1|nr:MULTISPECIES: ABC-three component system middle component 6 [Actinotignum]MDY5130224.1 ABC-three component system middle component 6 [Actinotignum timonense]MDY5144327.1 ABC-three component system middle component 6 [Actinotignum timonense]
MLLPTKGITPDRALLTIGARIIELLDSPATVSGLWERISKPSGESQTTTTITFDWFSLALSMLFAINALSWNESGKLVIHRVPA